MSKVRQEVETGKVVCCNKLTILNFWWQFMIVLKSFKSLHELNIQESNKNKTNYRKLTFEQYKNLSYNEKGKYLQYIGISFKPFNLMYRGEFETYYLPKKKNPFTKGIFFVAPTKSCIKEYKNRIHYDTHIRCHLCIVTHPKDPDNLLTFKPHFKKSLESPNIKSEKHLKSRELENKSLTNDISESIPYHKIVKELQPKTFFGTKDFLIRVLEPRCIKNQGHEIIDIIGRTKKIMRNLDIEEVKFPAAFCPVCNRYYILRSEYERIYPNGTLLCKFTDYFNYNLIEFWDFDESSILRRMGYTVNQNSYLTEDKRRNILVKAIKNEVLTKYEIVTFLNRLINLHYYDDKFTKAIAKWESDKEFISRYSIEGLPIVDVKSFIE